MVRLLSIFSTLLLINLGFLSAAEKPNIILILADDMGYSDLGCYGGEIDTPVLDGLAANGIRYTHFTNNAKCETTRTALMSGQHHTLTKASRDKSFLTIPEALKLADYQNFMVGKWHIFDTPMKRGFDRYFGFLEGATNFFNGEGTGGGFSYHLNEEKLTSLPDDFYSTDGFTDYALQFIEERDKERPFFLYMAHNAPHYPLQAPKEDVMKYRGRYNGGWEELRTQRHKRMIELGILPKGYPLSEPESKIPKWDALNAEKQDDMDLRMATYAAMIDRLDRQIGRVVTKLKSEKISDNTLIIFLSDNGACPFDRTRKETKENNYMPWDPRSYICYPAPWANACNTPFRMYKQNQHEGGIAAPMIAHWPKGISTPGSMHQQRGHVRDFHATFRELAGVTLPESHKGKPLLATDHSISLVPSFSGKANREHPFFYQFFTNSKSALVIGKWKLVDQKSLYDIEADRIESNDLSQSNPEQFQEMLKQWDKIHAEYNPKSKSKKKKTKKSKT